MKELQIMLDLEKFEAETLANHRQQQQDLNHLLPIIEDAGAVIVEKLALFRKYNRKVRSEVADNGNHISLTVIITKISPKRNDVAWLKSTYKITDGHLTIRMHGQNYGGTAIDPEEIACQFVYWYKARIEEQFRYALPF